MSFVSQVRSSVFLVPALPALVVACTSAPTPTGEPPESDTLTSSPTPGPEAAQGVPRALMPIRTPGARVPGVDASAGDSTIADGSSVPLEDASNNPAYDASSFGAWQPVRNAAPFQPDVGLVMTDGTVVVHDSQEGSNWWRFSPDNTGSYVNGTWSAIAPFPTGYEPTFFASAVLGDGRLVVIGGEYNHGAMVETPLGAIYDPTVNVWTPIQAPNPAGTWFDVGDAPSVVLPDGTFMMGSITGTSVAYFDARTLTWTTGGTGKADDNAEEGWTLLPNGKVLTVDVGYTGGSSCPTTMGSEIYDPATQTWTSAGDVPVQLAAGRCIYEIGPAILMPNGSVFATGATGNTAVYGPDGGWTAGPSFPTTPDGQYDVADGCAVLLPNGNVLCAASPATYQPGAAFFEFDGTNLTQVDTTQNALNDSSFNIFFLLLPSGQVLALDYSPDIEIYTPNGAANAAWAPTITSAPMTVVRGTTYPLSGTQLNGLSQAVAYGDDYQGATNYPLVRITNNATGHTFYGRTHDHSTMAVATGSATVSTLFEAPAGAETGPSSLVVVANGIPSAPVALTIQ